MGSNYDGVLYVEVHMDTKSLEKDLEDVSGIAEKISGALENIGSSAAGISPHINTAIDSVKGFMDAWYINDILDSIQRVGDLADAVNNIKKAVKKIPFSEMKNGLKGAAQGVGDFAKNSGSKMSSFFEGTFDSMKGAINKIPFSEMKEGLKGDAQGAGNFMKSIGQQGPALLTEAGQWIVNTAAKAANTVATWASQAATLAATAATWLFNAAMAVLTSPITLVVLAIAALIAIVILCVKHWDQIKEAAKACWDKIVEVWQTVSEWFHTNVVAPLVNFFTGLWDGIVLAAQTCWNFIVGIWQTVCEWFYLNVITPLVNFFTGLWDGIVLAAQTCWNFIVGIWQTVCEWFYLNVITPLVNFFTGLWDSLKNAAQLCLDFIAGIWQTVCEWFYLNVITPLTNFFTGLWDSLKNAAQTCWSFISGIWQAAGEWFYNNVIAPVSNFFSGLWDGIKNAFTNAWDFISGAFKGYINNWIYLIENFINFFINGINAIIKGLNRVNFDVPSWVPGIGGKKLGFNIPLVSKIQIPRLATGAVIPPNAEFAAILGDQKHGRNLEAPESLIRQIVREESGNNGGDWIIQLVDTNGRLKSETIITALERQNRRTGRTIIPVGV